MSKVKSKKGNKIVVTLKIGGIVVGLFGLAALINNIMIFNDSIKQYVEQGYPKEMVMQAMVPTQLLPGIFEPIALYGGLALLMFAVAVIACKLFPQEETLVEEVIEDVAVEVDPEDVEVVEPVLVASEF